MTIQEFTKKAVEGEWKNLHFLDTSNDGDGFYRMLLDPIAWQAVGKVEGWGIADGTCNKCGSTPRSWLLSSPVTCPDCRTARGEYPSYMHRFIDHLCDGLSLEEALDKATS